MLHRSNMPGEHPWKWRLQVLWVYWSSLTEDLEEGEDQRKFYYRYPALITTHEDEWVHVLLYIFCISINQKHTRFDISWFLEHRSLKLPTSMYMFISLIHQMRCTCLSTPTVIYTNDSWEILTRYPQFLAINFPFPERQVWVQQNRSWGIPTSSYLFRSITCPTCKNWSRRGR